MKRSTLFALLAVLALLLAACTQAPAPAALPRQSAHRQSPRGRGARRRPKAGGALTFAMKEDVTSLDPLKAIQYGDIRLNILVAQQLVAPDRAGKFVGVLAESWETSADGKTWTFKLRPGVKFHNGAGSHRR